MVKYATYGLYTSNSHLQETAPFYIYPLAPRRFTTTQCRCTSRCTEVCLGRSCRGVDEVLCMALISMISISLLGSRALGWNGDMKVFPFLKIHRDEKVWVVLVTWMVDVFDIFFKWDQVVNIQSLPSILVGKSLCGRWWTLWFLITKQSGWSWWCSIDLNSKRGGGLKDFLFRPYLGKFPILTSIFFKGVGSTTN